METPPPSQPPQDPTPQNPVPPQPAQPSPQPTAGYPRPGAMTMGPSIRFDVIGQAFNMVFADLGTWVTAALILFVAIGVAYAVCWFLIVGALLGGAMVGAGLFGMFFMSFLMIFIVGSVANLMLANMYRMAMIALSGVKPSVNEMFKFGPNVGNLLVASLLVAVFTGIGMIACYIGAIVVGGALMFAIPLVVDRNMPAMDAIKLSWETLKKDIVMAAVFFFVIAICAEIGGIVFGIGAIFTLPVLPIAISMLYKDYLGIQTLPPDAAAA